MQALELLIMDKDPVTNSALEVLLKDDERIHIAGNARNEEETFRIIEERKVDVVLMDINVNNKTYCRPLQRLKKRFPQQKVLCLLYEEPRVTQGILECGSEGTFFKERDLGKLADAIVEVHEEGRSHPTPLKNEIPDPKGLLSYQERNKAHP